MGQLAEALAQQEAVTMALIWLELDDLYASLSAAEDQAAARLRDALEALEEPLAHLERLDRAITDAEGRCVEWSERLSGDNPDTRAEARAHYEEWSAEVGACRGRRDEAERGYRELIATRDDARTRLRIVQAAKRRVMVAQLNPFGDELAQATEAYKALRMPHLNFVLLRNDRESPEWDRAIEELRELCLRSAYRTDDLPGNAELAARAMTAEMASAAATQPDPVPSAAELKAQRDVDFGNMALQGVREVVDDRRAARSQPVPPQRSYMDVPRIRDTLGG